MNSYYIKGNKERGAEVIKALEKKGGKNINSYNGMDTCCIYFIDKDNHIHIIDPKDIKVFNVILHFCTELTLPEKPEWKPKYKIGDCVREKYTGKSGIIFSIIPEARLSPYTIKFTDNSINSLNEDALESWEPKRGERVLVRASENDRWEEAIFSYSNPEGYLPYHTVGGCAWRLCILFDINKLGKI